MFLVKFTTAFGALGVVMQVYVIAILLFTPKLLNMFSFKILFLVSLNDAALSFSYALTEESYSNGDICVTQAFVMNYCALTSLFYHCGTAFILYRAFTTAVRIHHVAGGGHSELKKFLLVCQVLPLLPSIVPLVLEQYSRAGPWCWIHHDNYQSLILQFVCFYGWGWAAIVFCLWCYYRVYGKFTVFYQRLNDVEDNSDHINGALKTWKILRLYPASQILFLIGGTLDRVYEAFDEPPYSMGAFLAAAAVLQPIADAIIFGCNPVVTRFLGKALRAYFGGSNARPLRHVCEEVDRESGDGHISPHGRGFGSDSYQRMPEGKEAAAGGTQQRATSRTASDLVPSSSTKKRSDFGGGSPACGTSYGVRYSHEADDDRPNKPTTFSRNSDRIGHSGLSNRTSLPSSGGSAINEQEMWKQCDEEEL
mmetsp:Transcript_23416/g.37693  ORF Transcript_23416/g.37693 Transcript_23416/m.37693 type:complete len:422 (-) Transcript_23416:178-1443(-)